VTSSDLAEDACAHISRTEAPHRSRLDSKMVEGVVQGTLKLTIVAAKNVSSGGRDPSTLVRMRILNSPPGDPKGKPVASQLQVLKEGKDN
jgi:hypothetical protein